jgi:hypothetical protein
MKFWSRLFVTVCMVGFVTSGANAESSQLKPALAAQQSRDMTFRIMRASKAECEPNCPEWIFAKGQIVPGSAKKLKEIVALAGKSPLTLVVQSGGGDIKEAMTMGRFIRAHKMNVAVGFTYEFMCKEEDVFCSKTLKPRDISLGFVSTQPSYCASACTLVLASGVQRIVAANSVVGTHQVVNKSVVQKITYNENFIIVRGRKKLISKTETKRETIVGRPILKVAAADADLVRYVQAMGVDKSFLGFFEKAPPGDVYRMTWRDRLATHIVTHPVAPETYMRPELCKGETPAGNCVFVENDIKLSAAN